MKTKLNPSVALATAGWLAFTTIATANITSYLNQPDWLAAAGGTNSLTVFSFQGPTELTGKFVNDPTIVPSYASQGVLFLPFTGSTNYPEVFRDEQYQISAPNHDGLISNISSTNPVTDLEGRAIKFDFNIPVKSVGLNFNGPLQGGDYGYLEAFDTFGHLLGQTPVCVAGGFVGLVSDMPVTEVHVVNTGNSDITFGIWDLQFVSAFGPSCISPPAGLVSWWPGDGTAHDLVGGSNGITAGGVSFVPGEVGQAFSFDGSTGYVQLPRNMFLFPFSGTGNTPFSFELWFRTTSGGVILGQEQDTSLPFQIPANYVPAVYIGTDGKLRAAMFWDGGANGGALGDPIVATNTVSDGDFHHLAVVYDGTNQMLYLDSQLAGSRPWTQLGYATGYNYQFGTGYTGPGWPGGNGGWYSFDGLIDEVAYYNRALTAAEIQSIYAAGSLGKCKPPQMLPQDSGPGFSFGVQSVSNQSYTIQRNNDLTTANWIFYTNFIGNGSLMQLVAPVSSVPQRFFRVREP